MKIFFFVQMRGLITLAVLRKVEKKLVASMSMLGMVEFLYFRLVSGLLSLAENVFNITSFIGVIETKQPATAVIVG